MSNFECVLTIMDYIFVYAALGIKPRENARQVLYHRTIAPPTPMFYYFPFLTALLEPEPLSQAIPMEQRGEVHILATRVRFCLMRKMLRKADLGEIFHLSLPGTSTILRRIQSLAGLLPSSCLLPAYYLCPQHSSSVGLLSWCLMLKNDALASPPDYLLQLSQA